MIEIVYRMVENHWLSVQRFGYEYQSQIETFIHFKHEMSHRIHNK